MLTIAEEEIAAALDMTGDLVGVLAVGESTHSPFPPMDSPAMSRVSRVVSHRPEVVTARPDPSS